MEVAGIEPASEGISIEATTCLSQVLRFAYQTPLCRIHNRLSQKVIRGTPLENGCAASPYCDAFASLTGGRSAKRSHIKRLMLILHQHLYMFRLFNEACGDLDMQPISHLPSSKPLHPQDSNQRSVVSRQQGSRQPMVSNSPSMLKADSQVNYMPVSHSHSLHAQSCRVYRKVAYL